MPRSMASMMRSVSIGGLMNDGPQADGSGSTFQKLPNSMCPGCPGGAAPGQRICPCCAALSAAIDLGEPQVKLTTALGSLAWPALSIAVARQKRLASAGAVFSRGVYRVLDPARPVSGNRA